jgi:hypothetical protein
MLGISTGDEFIVEELGPDSLALKEGKPAGSDAGYHREGQEYRYG